MVNGKMSGFLYIMQSHYDFRLLYALSLLTFLFRQAPVNVAYVNNMSEAAIITYAAIGGIFHNGRATIKQLAALPVGTIGHMDHEIG